MPVNRCSDCHRGHAGYLDGEKSLLDLTPDEIRTEIPKSEAKALRIRNHISNLRDGVTVLQVFPDGRACADCGHGWREFQNHRKDLEQLTATEAKAALANISRWLGELSERHSALSPSVTGTQWMEPADDKDEAEGLEPTS